MGPWLLLLCCAWTLKSPLSSVLWQTPGTVRVRVGEAFTLQCIHKMKVQYCYSTTSWHKVSKRTGRLNEIRTELNMKQTDTKVCNLTIPNATLQDSGTYHCTGLYNKIVLVGNGTRVIVTDPGPLSPSIIMYSPLDVSGPIVPLQCLVMGAVPSQVQVVWIIDHSERSGWTESSWTENSDTAVEHTRAHLTLSEDQWTEAARIECLVMFDGTNISKSLVPGDIPFLFSRSWSASMCSWLMFLGIGFLTITAAVTVAVCLCRERQKDAAAEGLMSAQHPVAGLWFVPLWTAADRDWEYATSAAVSDSLTHSDAVMETLRTSNREKKTHLTLRQRGRPGRRWSILV